MAKAAGKTRNPYKCRVCGGFAFPDGYCGKDRPKRKRSYDRFRDNPLEQGWGWEDPGEEFGLADEFPLAKKWLEVKDR
jgi:hypothetical protein